MQKLNRYMKSEERLLKQKQIIEEIGKFFDKRGFQPIAGRILGLLMVMDKEQFTFEEITEELQISKSSASNVLRMLEIRGDIEYTTISGDRKRYYHIKRQNAFEMFDEFEKQILSIKKLFLQILELKEDKNSLNSSFFNEIVNLISIHKEHIQEFKKAYKNN